MGRATAGRRGLGFGCEQGADRCSFVWLYLGTSTAGGDTEPGRIPVLGSVGYVRDLPVPTESHSDLL